MDTKSFVLPAVALTSEPVGCALPVTSPMEASWVMVPKTGSERVLFLISGYLLEVDVLWDP